MQSFIRAIARLLTMGGVMAAVLTVALLAGVGTTVAIGLAIVLAGLVGLVGVARRPSTEPSAAEARAVEHAPPPHAGSDPTSIQAMAPRPALELDPEANMPRWRRPSLLEARRADPMRSAPVQRAPARFGDAGGAQDLRVVRYALVPLLDRPDELTGIRLTEVGTGDEVRVVGSSGAFLHVVCASGEDGWVHRTTLGPAIHRQLRDADLHDAPEVEDALSALLAARGLS